MRIGLNLLFLLPGETAGIQTHVCSLIGELMKLDSKNEYFLFLNRESRDLFQNLPANFHRVLCGFDARRRSVRYLWEQVVLPAQALARSIDLLHSMAYVGPVFAPALSIVTPHDVNFLAWGSAMGSGRRLVMGGICCAMAHRAEVVLTVSRFSAGEIVRRLWVRRNKIQVVPNAGPAVVEATRRPEAALKEPYIVAFGGGDQNKNVHRLVTAFGELAACCPHHLVLIGRVPAYVRESIAALPEEIRRRVVCAGFLGRREVLNILQGAEVFVFPSYYEGFGIPILEAQALDVPVVCSAAASLPEVGGESADYFDPLHPPEIAAAILRVLQDPERRERLRAKGRANVRRFSWRESALQLLGIYETSHAMFSGKIV